MLNRNDKIQSGLKLKEVVGGNKNAVIFQYSGITANRMNSFRKNLRNCGIKARCAGNRVQQHALKNSPISKLYDSAKLSKCNLILIFDDLKFGQASAEAKALKLNFIAGIIDGVEVFTDEGTLKEISSFKSSSDLFISLLGTLLSPLSYIAMLVEYICDELEKGVNMLDIKKELNDIELSEKLAKIIESMCELTIGELIQLKKGMQAKDMVPMAMASAGSANTEAAEAKPAEVIAIKVSINPTAAVKKLEAIKWLTTNVPAYSGKKSIEVMHEVLKPDVVLDKVFDSEEEAKNAISELGKMGIDAKIVK